ncbi:peptidoglycan DD-metalloendopeptidase family protein [Spirosoma aerolatum]|uniref:peptidoglycan DD-metalloendopeptidase family protein n=1 Tax=Spirosoma aerolatum TaxID=1211326 RepID=UPI0009AD684B|nr:peptidoglycan DD-metalloendopeptidase family protein [Spirosoma aerolatum]
MNKKLRPVLLLFLLLVSKLCLLAQPVSVGSRLEGASLDRQPCLTPQEHADIQQMLQQKLALLTKNGARKAATHPVFSFPLRWAKSQAPYGFWTISNYVDLNPSVGPDDVNQYTTYNLDYNCGNRTYDQKNGYQHQGTDIALWPFNWSVMAGEYVKVVAAAPGVIISKSDGNDDQSCGSFSSATRDWNAVYIRHDDGSVAWYGHLKKQSLTTKSIGQRVNEGEFLGFVGSSGRSSAPHLHFEVYNADGKLIDPFQGACNKTITDAWWKQQPLYKDKTLNRLSVHLVQPVMGVCPGSANVTNEVVVAQPGQRFYFYAFGRELENGDPIQFDVFQPDGQLFTTFQDKSTSSFANFYWYIYVTIPADAPNGKWTFRTLFNGKTYERTFIVAKDFQSVVQISPSGRTSFCTGDSVTLTANVETNQYIWKKDGVVLSKRTDQAIVARESGTYTAELTGAVSNAISVTAFPSVLPTATLAGNQTIYEGQPANLSVTFTGEAPWNLSYRDSTASGLGTVVPVVTSANPYAFQARPTKSTGYQLVSVSNVCGNGNLLTKSVVVVVNPLLGIDDPSLTAAVEVYPVPAASAVTVQVNGLHLGQVASFVLTDMNGHQILMGETRQRKSTIQLDTYQAGTYLLQIQTGDRKTTRRIIKL